MNPDEQPPVPLEAPDLVDLDDVALDEVPVVGGHGSMPVPKWNQGDPSCVHPLHVFPG